MTKFFESKFDILMNVINALIIILAEVKVHVAYNYSSSGTMTTRLRLPFSFVAEDGCLKKQKQRMTKIMSATIYKNDDA